MQIRLTSIMVNDQPKAHRFYTEVLGFVTKHNVDLGEAAWLTVVSPEDPEGVELLLEPMAFAPARTYQAALYADGMPAAMLYAADVRAETARLQERGVQFRSQPEQMPWGYQAIFDDTVGNWILLTEAQ